MFCEPLQQTPAMAPVYLPVELQEALMAASNQRSPHSSPMYPYPNPTTDLIQRLQALYRPAQPQPPPSLFQPPPSFRTSPYSGSPVMQHRSSPCFLPAENSPSEPQQFTFTAKEFAAAAAAAAAATATTPSPSSPAPTPEPPTQFIRPLSQVGTLTTTDPEGRVKVVVPVQDEPQQQLAAALSMMRVSMDGSAVGRPVITRSTSEKVPNRSELMSQVQRTAWARHTTK